MEEEEAVIPRLPIFMYMENPHPTTLVRLRVEGRVGDAASRSALSAQSAARVVDDATVTPPGSGLPAVPVERSDRHGHCPQEACHYTFAHQHS
jgi:hypothetical protein